MIDVTLDNYVLTHRKVEFDVVDRLHRRLLGRPLDRRLKHQIAGKGSVFEWIDEILDSREFKAQRRSPDFIPDASFRAPRLLATQHPKAVLYTGSCMMEMFMQRVAPHYADIEFVHAITNNGSELADFSVEELKRFDLQFAQIGLRHILHDGLLFRGLGPDSAPEAHAEAFAETVRRMRTHFETLLKYRRLGGPPLYVLNFAVPQKNPLGSISPRYGYGDLRFFVEELNRALYGMCEAEVDVHLIDFDSICSTLGKRYITDELTSHTNHASFLSESFRSLDIALTPHGPADDLYAPKVEEASCAIFEEILATHYVQAPTPKIKLVIFDLDGTLWRGVAAEMEDIAFDELREGWPLSILEAANTLRNRGVLIALASKNDREFAERTWESDYGRLFPFAHFASVRIGWESKAASVESILREVNLLPESCLFVDDNPAERDEVSRAFPDMSILDGPILTWKRKLLWSPELQVPARTQESANRSQSIQAMAERAKLETRMDRAEFLRSLDVAIKFDLIADEGSPLFARMLELLNKTNQFNTTGRRWSAQEIAAFFAEGGQILAATVSDRLTPYGLTALLLFKQSVCVQMIMSCRVFGLEVEHALFRAFLDRTDAPAKVAFARTPRNQPAFGFLKSLGVEPVERDGVYDIPEPNMAPA